MAKEIINESTDTERIKEILRKVRRIDITTRHKAGEMLSGHYRSVFKGRGIEFSEVRDYVFGDSIKQIEWNVTARMGKPYIKQFVEERELNIILALDVSPSMYFGSFPVSTGDGETASRHFKIDTASEIIATLSVSASMNNDKIGLILYDNAIRKYIPQKKTRDQSMRIIREVMGYRPVSAVADLQNTLRYIMSVQKKRGVLFVISDFEPLDDYKEIPTAKRRFDLVPVIIIDRRETELGNHGFLNIYDPESGEDLVIDSSSRRVRNAYRKVAEEKISRKRMVFKKNGIDFIEIYTHTDYIPGLVRFFRMREHRFSL